MKSKLFKMFLVVLTVISSITTGLLLGAKGSQALSTETVKVYVKEVTKKDDLFYITLEKDLDVVSLTYEYVTWGTESKETKVSYLVNHADGLKKLSSCKYSFTVESETEQEVIGLKVYKVQYQKSKEYFPNHMTEGNFTWNSYNFENVVRLKWLEVTDDKLVKVKSGVVCNNVLESLATGGILSEVIDCDNLYFLYFNLNTEELGIDFERIDSLDLEYTTYETRHGLFGAVGGTKKYNRKTHEAHIVYNDKVTIRDGIKTTKEYHIIPSDIDGYQWKTYVGGVDKMENSILGLYYEKHYIEDVAMFRITYYKDGEYTTAELLDFPTGVNVHQPGFLTKLIDWLTDHYKEVFFVILFAIFWKPIFALGRVLIKGTKTVCKWLFVPRKKKRKYYY